MAWPGARDRDFLDTEIETVQETRERYIPGSRPSSKMKEGRRGAHSLSESSATLLKSSPITAEGHFISPTRAEQLRREVEEAGPGPGKDEGEKVGQVNVLEGDQSSEQGDHHNKEHPGHWEDTLATATLFVIPEQDHPEPAFELPQPPGEVPTTPDKALPNEPNSQQQTCGSDSVSTTALVSHPTTGTDTGGYTPTTASDPAGQGRPASGIGQQNDTIHQERVRHAKKGRVVVKARRVILRKKVLSVILGRKLAGTVHPLLQTPAAG
ncbi:hypothetical protein DV738_g2190, partial [Chaetothyriales sp. CBS 135597]